MRIVRLEATNIKKLKAVRITPDGNIVKITGANANGKTSVLDCISMALGGAGAIPAKPIREGARRARITLDLGDIVAERVWTDDAHSYFSIKPKDGGKAFASPQTLADSFMGRISFDPLEFARMEPAAQFGVLRKLVDLGIDEAALSKERTDVFLERTLAARELKAAEAVLKSMIAVDAPDEPVNVADLLAEQDRLSREKSERDEQRRAVKDEAAEERRTVRKICDDLERVRREAEFDSTENTTDINNSLHEIEKAKTEILEIEDKLNTARARLRNAEDVAKAFQQAGAARAERLRAATAAAVGFGVDDKLSAIDAKEAEALAAIVEPAPSDIADRIRNAETVNANVRRKQERAAKAAEVGKLSQKCDGFTAEIQAIDDAKAKALADAKFPVAGLSFEFQTETVLYKGLPFGQGSAAEQLIVSLSIAMALNPKLRVIRITDGSLLDSKSMDIITKMAADKDYQVWIECVNESGDIGFYLEDGELVAVDGKAVAKIPAEKELAEAT